MVLVVVIAIGVAGAATGAATLFAQQAQTDLGAAQLRTQDLLSEQLQYAEAASVASLLANTEGALIESTATDVVWGDVLNRITPILPPNAYVNITAASRAPWEEELSITGPLRAPRVGTITLDVSSPTIFDASALVRRLSSVEGFADATFDLASEASAIYAVTITINLGELALSDRMTALLGEEAATKDDQTADSDDSAATEGESE